MFPTYLLMILAGAEEAAVAAHGYLQCSVFPILVEVRPVTAEIASITVVATLWIVELGPNAARLALQISSRPSRQKPEEDRCLSYAMRVSHILFVALLASGQT